MNTTLWDPPVCVGFARRDVCLDIRTRNEEAKRLIVTHAMTRRATYFGVCAERKAHRTWSTTLPVFGLPTTTMDENCAEL